MKKYKLILIIVNLTLFLWVFNSFILQKEKLLSNGQLVLLELAPADSYSFMQGDYMKLKFTISDNILQDSIPKRGFCVVKLEENGVAKKVRIQENKTPLYANEYIINYTSKKRKEINIGATSYFFQEGKNYLYEKAKYGGIKVDTNGNSVLIGLYDKNGVKIDNNLTSSTQTLNKVTYSEKN